MRSIRPRVRLRVQLLVVVLVALGIRGWSTWLRYRTEQVFESFPQRYDRDTGGHQSAAEAILAIGGGRASVPPLIEALRSGDSGKQFTAGMALASIGPEAFEAVPALIELLDSPDLYARQVAPGALVAIGPAAKPAVPALLRALNDKEWLIRSKAAYAIFVLDPQIVPRKVVPTLMEMLNDPDPMARAEALEILEMIKKTGLIR
jgi:HEAT repeat protein